MRARKLGRLFNDLPLRRKLILTFLTVVGLGGVLTLLIGTRIEQRTIMTLAEAKVGHDLASARMVYEERLNGIRDTVRLSAVREIIKEALRTGRVEAAAATLDFTRRAFGLDILNLTDSRGRIVIRSRRAGAPRGDDVSQDPYIRRALRGEVAAGTHIASREELAKEDPELAERARFRLIATPMAAPRPDDYEERGMMLMAAAPIVDQADALLGVLYGGLLFNRDYELVDRVKEIVFKGEKYKGHDIGTATLFLDDLRIATNVLDDAGQRAIGTRVSREVREAVLLRAETYIGRAFVVTAWHITAYGPLRDIEGRTVGMLYVGMLERPYVDLRNRVMGKFTVMAGLCALFLVGLLSFIARRITRPLGLMVEATDKIAAGDLDHNLELTGRDEIGHLAGAFNRMTENLRAARQDLTQWTKTLERRVEERTGELRKTQDQLIQSAKLASLGKMAAGVAHEINNPLTTILIQAHLQLERCTDGDPSKEALTLIAEETARCAQIVGGLLNFARQTPSRAEPSDINEIVDRALQLLEKQASVRNIRFVKQLDRTLPQIRIDRNKIQQVFSNLALNACEAMSAGGTLTVSSRWSRDGTCFELAFADTGTGIAPAHLAKIFDPFFSTKSFGTGLGLAVSYGIVRQRGGTMDVLSDFGRGATFTVRLPLEAPAENSEYREDMS